MIAAALIGVPTAIIATSWFSRMTPVQWWNYPVWVTAAALTGLIAATYVAPVRVRAPQESKALIGALISAFAVGCPVCNKLVVLALGTSGALTYFAPLQPVLAVSSLVILAVALRRRLTALRACPAPGPRAHEFDSAAP
ncbi:unnamed protein product [[Actinomadura] parvosata subsp. kistnae]|nr:unnamed protein product [Actinomadura parvosata subsp. kistnae]